MRIAIIGGNPDDERHLGRLAEKAGHAATFVRSRVGAPATPGSPSAAGVVASVPPSPDVLEHVLARLEREGKEEPLPGQQATPHQPQALVFDPGPRPDAAARVVAAVRRDPYFDRFGTVLVLHAEHIGAIALPGGFDDFVLYPCGVDELTIRVRALAVRRSALAKGRVSDDGSVVVDEASRDVIVDGRAVQLTAREFALFTYLCEWRGRVLSREHLLARVWGSRYSGGRRTVDIHVRRLRAKLGASLSIETLRGSGYRLRREPTHSDAAPESADYRTDSPRFDAQMPEPFSKVS
jgi:DNA-binding winged helix-turn-helix (wHTH) protein